MRKEQDSTDIITNLSIRDFFYDTVSTAVANQKQTLATETIFYITNLLTRFSRAEEFFEITEEGPDLRPLALIYADAAQSETRREKLQHYKYLGDVALFVSGLYAASLNRSLVGVDYYIGMGESAYAVLADSQQHLVRELAFHIIYDELAGKFISIVEVLNEVGDRINRHDNADLIKLYENWIRNSSDYATAKLKENGIAPVRLMNGETRH